VVKTNYLIVTPFAAICTLTAVTAVAQPGPALTADEATAIATEAYIYGYPLVTMEMTRRVMTNAVKPEGTHAPMFNFCTVREYPTAAFRDVTAPNADTLYCTAWLDLGNEPWVLHIPDMGDRYYLFPMLSGWTDVFQVPGKRTGIKGGDFAITGPSWKGMLPAGVQEYKSPTNMVWILGRIYCTGTPEDYKAVHALQDQLSLTPLSSFGKPFTPPAGKVDPSIDMKTAVRDQVNKMDAGAYFSLLATLMRDNPPAAADAPMVAKMAKIGLVPGQPFDLNDLDPTVAKAVQAVPKPAFEKIMAAFKSMRPVNGWMYATTVGVYGTEYLTRALVTAIGLGANRPQDAIYPTSETDADGKPYEGTNKYVIHFAKGQMPPVKGFWSLTMYDDEMFFVANPLNRYNLSSRNKFNENPDGSVDLYLQKDNPGPDKEANWLPAPAGRFIPMFRFYWPDEAIINGTWQPPAIKKVTQ
jgi:hypothetical protein